MYAVVGCSECTALWIVEGRPETTACPRCRTRHQFARLKTFVETDDENEARDARATMLAKRSDEEDALDALQPFEAMEQRAQEAGVSDETYLAGSGVDPDEVTEAATEDESGGASSRREVVIEAVERLEEPTEAEVVGYATDRGVSGEYARKALEKLVSAGRASESGGQYRLL